MFKSDSRFSVSKKYYNLFTDLNSNVFPSHSSIFILCVLLGYNYGTRKSLESTKQLFRVASLNPEEVLVLKSLSIEEENCDYSLLSDNSIEDKIINMLEEYANSGMEIFIEEFLNNYIKQSNGEYYLDFTKKNELSKIVLGYIMDKVEEEPI
ncbi:MAG: hypothetical protein FXF47_04945 [Candidatus Mcinerneyibacterium aminivorans]|uniref:Uncharacterized protein n=1 Tax=Candidatus Mcinerneyibacterium aminivorans TaxID=2703815 RepID=A0A5D0MFU1_9BACT|nr:MAG: hypothetical protein FXF47_04945 [Candidatus Mcinerneyibacterium aminivorans]